MIKVGIAGFGKIGQLRYQLLKKFKDVKVTGLYDVDMQTHIPDDVTFFDSFENLIESGIDAIFICSYNKFLSKYTIKSIQKNIHVFCEKPPAMSTVELSDVKKEYSKASCVLKYGFNHRYHYSVIEAKKIIDSGQMGKLLWMRGVYGKAGSIDYDKNWRNYKKYSGGGILIDQGIHMLDLMRYLSIEEFTEINSFVTTAYWKIKVEDNAFIIMKSKNDVIASMHSSATHWKHKFLLELYFEHGYINLDGILSSTRSYAPEKLVVGKREFEDITYAMGKPKETITYFENDDSWRMEIEEFLNAITKGDNLLNGTIDDAFNTLSLVEEVYKNSGF